MCLRTGQSRLRSFTAIELNGELRSPSCRTCLAHKKKSAGLSPGATFGPMKNLDVFNRGPKFLSVPLSSQLTAKEMPLTKQLIY
jgi:hypothetical protein